MRVERDQMSPRVERPGARWWVPERPSLHILRSAIQACQGCELHVAATQAVMGAGSAEAQLMILGEQPGEQEDRAGRPFVGSAGQLLERALAEAGIDPGQVYRTNVVKHFRFEVTRGERRLHKSPSRVHVAACGPWLLAELAVVRPTGVVVLGGTAGKALYGRGYRVGRDRGRLRSWPEGFAAGEPGHRPDWVLTTAHPAAVLRSPQRGKAYAELVKDLAVAAAELAA